MYSIWGPILFVLLVPISGEITNPYVKLKQSIFKNYDPNVRPTSNPNNRTVIIINVWPVHLSGLDENKGILSMECWIEMTWKDEFLSWNPDEFDGITTISLPTHEIWNPDMGILYGKNGQLWEWEYLNIGLNHSGFVRWTPVATLELYCYTKDYSQYPQDVQKCDFRIGSMSLTSKDLELQLHKENITYFRESRFQNPHWQFVSIEGEIFYYMFAFTGPHSYMVANYEMVLKRKNVPYSSMGSLPATVAQILLLSMFWMPDLTKKLILACTSVLSLIAIAASVTRGLPSPAAAPTALSKINSSLVLCALAVVVEILVLFVSSCRLNPPSFLDRFADSSVGKIIHPCINHQPSSSGEYSERIAETEPKKKPNAWLFLAVLIDRVAFVVFTVMFMIV